MADLSDDELSGACSICGKPVRYGSRHVKCGDAADRALNAAPSVGADGLPPMPKGKLMGSGVINGKRVELRMHDDDAMRAYALAALASRPAVGADTERLNWLEQHPNKVHYFKGLEPRKWGCPDTGFYETLREAIDAARHPAQREGE